MYSYFEIITISAAIISLVGILPVAITRKHGRRQRNIYILANITMIISNSIRIKAWFISGGQVFRLQFSRNDFRLYIFVSAISFILYFYYVCLDENGRLNYNITAIVPIVGSFLSVALYAILAITRFNYIFEKIAIILTIAYAILFIVMTRSERENAFSRIMCLLIPIPAVIIEIKFPGLNITQAFFALSLAELYISYQNELENQLIKKDLELSDSKVKLLISQIQPHFIFNSLESIERYCREDPEKAEECIIEFSGYLRNNLDSLSDDNPIPLLQEIEHCKQYIALETIDATNEIKIKYELEDSDFYIPPLTVEPLVENAIRHGVMMNEGGGTVTIKSYEDDDCYVVIVEDDGIGINNSTEKQKSRKSVGTSNVRKRLAAKCNGTLDVYGTDNGTRAVISIPK